MRLYAQDRVLTPIDHDCREWSGCLIPSADRRPREAIAGQTHNGDDDHGDVDVIMHIGGPFAAYKKIAEIATARTGQAVPIVQPIRRACTALMEDGTGVQFERMAYEHPAAQAVHEAITSHVDRPIGDIRACGKQRIGFSGTS